MVLKELSNLKRLSLANNFLNGKLSEDSGYLSKLEELDLDEGRVRVVAVDVLGSVRQRRVLALRLSTAHELDGEAILPLGFRILRRRRIGRRLLRHLMSP